jgi:hypothetical protein
MTAQIGERIRYKGKNHTMAAEPFGIYLEKHGIQTVSWSTANWRGYHGEWKIKNGRLFLVAISAYIPQKTSKDGHLLQSDEDCSLVGLDYFFPGRKEVFAEWFSGEIRIPIGKMLAYIHMGYESIFEKDLIIEFKEGIKISEREIDNRDEYIRLAKSYGLNDFNTPVDMSFHAAIKRLMAFAENCKKESPKEPEDTQNT